MTAVQVEHGVRFRDSVARHIGLHFDDTRAALLEDMLRQRLDITGLAVADYLDLIDDELPAAERDALATALTVGETYFFRNVEQIRTCVRHATRSIGSGPISVLSAGCATGEEPYTLAMAFRSAGVPASILGVDLNPDSLARARAGRYTPWALRDTDADVRARFFTPAGRELIIDPAIRQAVDFEQRNLAIDDVELWAPNAYDVVFCRNVLMYFTREAARDAVARIAGALRPGGLLFLGHAETLRELSSDFELVQADGAFHYRLASMAGTARPPAVAARPAPTPPTVDVTDVAWFRAISESSAKVEQLTGTPRVVAAPEPRHAESAATTLGVPRMLVQQERFAEALEALDQLPAAQLLGPDAQLLRAVLLTHRGLIEQAEVVSWQLLREDEQRAAAHHVLALCCESRGDVGGAIAHDRSALAADASFGIARLHLGRMVRRTGDDASARRELGLALTLLQREEPERILLFGAGFTVSSLIALCREELRAVEATR